MLTIKEIERDDYSTNDIADLLMRVQIAEESLGSIADLISIDSIKAAFELAVNTRYRIIYQHDCDVSSPCGDKYRCSCDLIASHDNGVKSVED